MKAKGIHTFNTIGEFHKMSGLPKPEHPLVSLVDYGLVEYQTDEKEISWVQHFYTIGLKRNIQASFVTDSSNTTLMKVYYPLYPPGRLCILRLKNQK